MRATRGIRFGFYWTLALANFVQIETHVTSNDSTSKNPINSKVEESQSPSLPQMIDIPLKFEDILSDDRFLNHKGLQAAAKSKQNERSSRNVYILTFGMANAGKSSVLHSILGLHVTPASHLDDAHVTSSNNSPSPSIIEYIANIPIPELGIQNSQLHVIDTPELELSSEGISLDANIFSTLDHFITHYPELNSIQPNLLLIFLSLAGNQFEDDGPRSDIVNILSRLDVFKEKFSTPPLYNKENNNPSSTNIMFVLARRLNEGEEITQRKIAAIRSTIQNYTNFPEPINIILIDKGESEENVHQNEELNNNSQNLITAMSSSLNSTCDLIGKTMLQMLTNSSLQQNVQFTIAQNQSLLNDTEKIQNLLDLWSAIKLSHATPTNQISELLKATYNERLDFELKKSWPGSLQLLQKIFSSANITNQNQLPSTKPSEVIKFLQNINTNLNPAMLALLQSSFPIMLPEASSYELLIGRGYDPLTDSSTTESPFDLNHLVYSKSLGMMIPSAYSVKIVQDEKNVIKFHSDLKDFISTRMSQELNLNEALNYTNFKGELRTVDNVFSLLKNSLFVQVVAQREIRTFNLSLNNNHENGLKFKEEFLDVINNLPKLNLYDKGSVNEWRTLLNEYGTHIIGSAFGGGYLKATMQIKNRELNTFRAGNLSVVKNVLESLLNSPGDFVNPAPADFIISLKLRGGDSNNYQTMNVYNCISRILDEWKVSLNYEPVMLENSLKLIPLSEYVQSINSSAGIQMIKATKALLEGRLEYVSAPSSTKVGSHSTGMNSPSPSANSNSSNQLPQKIKQAAESSLSKLNKVVTIPINNNKLPPAISPTATQRRREDFDATNKLLECLQMFIESLDVQISKSSSNPELLTLANEIETLYNKIASTSSASSREKLVIENLCKSYSKVLPPPIERLKTLVQHQGSSDTNPDHESIDDDGLIVNSFPEIYHQNNINNVANNSKDDIDKLARLKHLAETIWGYTNNNEIGLPSRRQVQVTDYKFIGYGYDLLWDSVTSSSPFILTENSFIKKKLKGFELPHPIFQHFSSKSEYIRFRLSSTTLNPFLLISPSKYKARMKPGHSTNDRYPHVSIVYEFKTMFVKLLDVHQLHLSEEFKNVVVKLAPYYSEYNSNNTSTSNNNCTVRNKWARFLNHYGTFVVKEGFIGGAIEIQPLNKLRDHIIKLRRNETELKSLLKSRRFDNSSESQFRFRVIGGNSSIFSSRTSFTTNQLNSWIKSIESNPVILPINVKLISLQKVIQTHLEEQFNSTFSILKNINEAVNAYYDGSLEACKGSIRCGLWLVYNETSKSCTCPAGQILSNTENDGESCDSLVGSNCSITTWSSCILNSDCLNVAGQSDSKGHDEQPPICVCNEGYTETSDRKCFRNYGESCRRSNDCDINVSMSCAMHNINDSSNGSISGRCECDCGESFQIYNSTTKTCNNLPGKNCEKISKRKNSLMQNLICDNRSEKG